MDILVFFSTPKQVELLHAPVLLTGDFALILYTRRAPLPVIRSGAHNHLYRGETTPVSHVFSAI